MAVRGGHPLDKKGTIPCVELLYACVPVSRSISKLYRSGFFSDTPVDGRRTDFCRVAPLMLIGGDTGLINDIHGQPRVTKTQDANRRIHAYVLCSSLEKVLITAFGKDGQNMGSAADTPTVSTDTAAASTDTSAVRPRQVMCKYGTCHRSL